MSKYYAGRLTATDGKRSIICDICGEDFMSVKLREDKKQVCSNCYEKDTDKHEISHSGGEA